jgi:hypothetical protein
MSEFTRWFRMTEFPSREGEYEGREAGSRGLIPVFWKRLDDTPKADWYFDAGYLGPFRCWKSARENMTAWRGLAENPAAPQTKKG